MGGPGIPSKRGVEGGPIHPPPPPQGSSTFPSHRPSLLPKCVQGVDRARPWTAKCDCHFWLWWALAWWHLRWPCRSLRGGKPGGVWVWGRPLPPPKTPAESKQSRGGRVDGSPSINSASTPNAGGSRPVPSPSTVCEHPRVTCDSPTHHLPACAQGYLRSNDQDPVSWLEAEFVRDPLEIGGIAPPFFIPHSSWNGFTRLNRPPLPTHTSR